MKYLFFPSLDSTNSYCKREYERLDDSTLVYTYHQTQGKGRLGRRWEDDEGSLLFSILLKKDLAEERVPLLSLLCSSALFLTLRDENIPSLIKWPNDVLVEEKKVSGILLESVISERLDALILGIGINVNNEKFPDDIKEKATSLFLQTGKRFDKKRLLENYVSHFEKLYSDYQRGKDTFLTILKENSYLDGKQVSLNYYGENKEGVVLGIKENGNLLLKGKKGIFEVQSGEVTLENSYHKRSNAL